MENRLNYCTGENKYSHLNILKLGFIVYSFMFLFSHNIIAQSDPASNDIIIQSIGISDSGGTISANTTIAADTTLPAPAKPKLLPSNISFLENTFWGEKGVFRGIGLTGELNPQTRMNELNIRRTMLTAHQIGGFATLGMMLATCYYGQKIIDGGTEGRRKYADTKDALVGATITSYSITALLSLLSPPPMIRRDEFSTTTLHKTLAWLHVAGMIITPILADMIAENGSMKKAHVHQLAGYLTTAAFATAMIVITF